MADDHSLGPPSVNSLSIARMDLKPQEKLLLVELALTAENVGTQLSVELQFEFVREFTDESPELLQRVFRAWRRRSKFMPKISEIYDLIEEEAQARYQKREAERYQACRAEAEAARESWNDPAQKEWRADQIKALSKRMAQWPKFPRASENLTRKRGIA